MCRSDGRRLHCRSSRDRRQTFARLASPVDVAPTVGGCRLCRWCHGGLLGECIGLAATSVIGSLSPLCRKARSHGLVHIYMLAHVVSQTVPLRSSRVGSPRVDVTCAAPPLRLDRGASARRLREHPLRCRPLHLIWVMQNTRETMQPQVERQFSCSPADSQKSVPSAKRRPFRGRRIGGRSSRQRSQGILRLLGGGVFSPRCLCMHPAHTGLTSGHWTRGLPCRMMESAEKPHAEGDNH